MEPIASFQSAVAELRSRFPWLAVQEVADSPEVDALVEIPVQPGLSFAIRLNLQNRDELHLVASHLWVEWFPCTTAETRDAFVRAVAGLIGGELEIVESFVLGRPASAVLRSRDAPGEPLARWSNLWALAPLPRAQRVVRNAGAA